MCTRVGSCEAKVCSKRSAHHREHPNDEVMFSKNLSSRIVLSSNIEEQNVCFFSYRNGTLVYSIY